MKLITIAIISTIICCSCTNNNVTGSNYADLNCNYQGATVMNIRSRAENGRNAYYDIKYQGEIIDVFVLPIYDNYNVGDVINKPCIK